MKAGIPVFDISSINDKLAHDIVEAASEHGFLFIKASNLQFRGEDVSNVFNLSKSFFDSPISEKKQCQMQKNNRGWTSMGSETLDPATQKAGDPKEAFNFGEFVDGKAQQPLPPAFQAHEAQLARFSSLCYGLCLQLLRLFAIGLEIEGDGGEHWFSTRHDPAKGDSGTILRLLHYPATHSTAPVRAGAHSDYGSLTLLFRLPGQPGLEILTPEEQWASVPVLPPSTEDDAFPPILVNIGDLLSYWTDGLLKSTVHRVVGDSTTEAGGLTQNRYSIAFFCHPCRETALVPVPSRFVKEKARRNKEGIGYGSGANAAAARTDGKVLTADQHLYGRLAATYGWNHNAEAV